MSYREENGKVVLTMDRGDYCTVISLLNIAAKYATKDGGDLRPHLEFLNRLNEGNPDYIPYRLEAKR